MKKLKKLDYIYICILMLTLLFIVLIQTQNSNIYGSTMDWESQHFIFPDFFRTLFYSTKNLMPNFAFNIGAGQNIYYFAYYGLFSPIILISYLLPFISMATFISLSSIILVGISTVMFYKFLKNHHCNEMIAFLASFIFLCSGPLIFHSHRHIMFINYMPFLIMGLFAIDKYFIDKKRWLLILSIFLIIVTSYYYSITSLIVLVIYGIYRYIKINDKITISNFFKDGFHFLTSFIIGVTLAAFLLLPIIYVILQGRSDVSVVNNITSMLLPTLNISFLLYSPYSIGLTAISFISIISLLFSKQKGKIFLGITILLFIIFPVLTYILNGKMYLDPKVLIPFLPLICYIVAIFLKDLFSKNTKNLKYILLLSFILIILGLIITKDIQIKLAIIDFIIMALFIYLFNKTNNRYFLFIPITIITFVVCLGINANDELISRHDFNDYFNKKNQEKITNIIKEDPDIYRVENQFAPSSNVNKVINDNHYITSIYSSLSNKNYSNFYFNIFKNDIPFRNNAITPSSKNILFQTYMGIKYNLTNKPSIGYEKTNIKKVYKNDNVLPIGYSTDKILSKKEFDKLSYPYTVDALLNYIIVNTDDETKYTPTVSPLTLNYKVDKMENLIIEQKKPLKITSKGHGSLSLKLDQIYQNKIIIIKFKMLKSQSCKKGDTAITINGIKNKLTCSSWKYHNQNYEFEYAISSNNIDKLDIIFDDGEYLIDNIETYIMDYDNVKSINSTVDPLKINKEKTKGDYIYGTIDVKKDGYLYLSIPYDKGFTFYLNDKIYDYEKVDTSFIGLPIKQGNYDIKITYEAPLSKIGQTVSLSGIISYIIIVICDKKKRS